MMTNRIDRAYVAESIESLPPFPRTVGEILATLDDPDSNLNLMSALIRRDPVIAARILSQANVAASCRGQRAPVREIYQAMSLIGLTQVRRIVLIGTCHQFAEALLPAAQSAGYWQHSVAVGVCCEELALYVEQTVSSSTALIAGLLHDIGQLWLRHQDHEADSGQWARALTAETGIADAERERYGVNHGQVGAWLAELWSLPPDIVAAIRHHHDRDPPCETTLVPLLHVAEVLSNALDLTGRAENRVTAISARACRHLGLTWNDGVRPLFGRIEARSSHANALLE
jgi:putative nucleotidyltransferase with HDIG domain